MLCLCYIQKSSKDPIPEEEFEFQGLEDEEECGTEGERKDSSSGDKAEKGGRESWKLFLQVLTAKAFLLFIYFCFKFQCKHWE